MTTAGIYDLMAQRQHEALDHARALAAAGIPIFIAKPARDRNGDWQPDSGAGGCGYWLPQGWQHTKADPATIDAWEPGDALAAVMGHGLDLLDVDPRSGGDDTLAGMRGAGIVPTTYAEAATPSGGWHGFVRSLNVGSRDGIAPGVDVKAGTRQGDGRGFAFIAPTVRLSKATGELTAYRWTTPPDLDRYTLEADQDDTGQALAELVRAARRDRTTEAPTAATGALSTVSEALAPSPWDDVPATLAEGRHRGVVRLASALRGRGGWRAEDALAYMRAVVWPQIDQGQGGHPYTLEELAADVRDVFSRYEDGGSAAGGKRLPTSPEDDPGATLAGRMIDGGAFILDTPAEVPAVWGNNGGEVLWSQGESCILAGPPGVGKTTLTGQVVRALIGLDDAVLGYPVTPAGGRVLYLAMDRPRQIARALARHFTPAERDALDDKLRIWPGPPPADVAKNPGILAALAAEAGASHVILDSLKDAALGLSEDEVGAGYNRARQIAIAAGVELLELHHVVKRGANGAKPRQLEDLYGSVWISSGAGSVILLWGAAGDPIVELSHLKQPAEPVGPLRVIHDHGAGRSDVWHSTDPLTVVRLAGAAGVTAQRLACAIFETDKPTPSETEKARRRLDKLVRDGLAETFEVPDPRGGPARTAYREHSREHSRQHLSTTALTEPETTHDPGITAGQPLTEAHTAHTPPSTHVSPHPFKGGGTGGTSTKKKTTPCPECAEPLDQPGFTARCRPNHQETTTA